ncbi:hypothetical protein EVC24_145 [Rhizobium phage RHph_I4]|nr:hypothetical protein EVC24_145 [Rhizobium phage RHph_I4]
MADHFVVLYRSGGWANATWRKTATTITSEERAQAEVASLMAMGFKALYRTQKEHDVVGLPVGWNWRVVDHAKDEIHINEWSSVHKVHPDRFDEVNALVHREGLT